MNSISRSAEPVPGQREAAADRTARPGILNSPPVVVGVIAFLLLIHGLRMAAGEEWETWTIYAFALIPARFGGLDSTAMIEGCARREVRMASRSKRSRAVSDAVGRSSLIATGRSSL